MFSVCFAMVVILNIFTVMPYLLLNYSLQAQSVCLKQIHVSLSYPKDSHLESRKKSVTFVFILVRFPRGKKSQ